MVVHAAELKKNRKEKKCPRRSVVLIAGLHGVSGRAAAEHWASAVREALRELSVMRVVDFEAYKGVRVRTFSNAEIRDAYEVRAVLEDAAAQRAARVFKRNAKSLYHFLEQMKKTASEGDVKGYLNYDLPLHRAIVAAAGNEHLLRAWDSLGFEIRAYLFLTRDNRDLPKMAEEHLPIVKALESGDGRKAGALLRRHCLTFAKEVMTLESPSSSP